MGGVSVAVFARQDAIDTKCAAVRQLAYQMLQEVIARCPFGKEAAAALFWRHAIESRRHANPPEISQSAGKFCATI